MCACRPSGPNGFLYLVVMVPTVYHLFSSFLYFNAGPSLVFSVGCVGFLLFHINFPVACLFVSLTTVVLGRLTAMCVSIRGRSLFRSARFICVHGRRALLVSTDSLIFMCPMTCAFVRGQCHGVAIKSGVISV